MAAKPVRLQLSRKKGFDLQAVSLATNGLPAVNVARPHFFGNPFPTDVYGRAGAVDRFRRFMAGQMSSLEMSQCSRSDRWAERGVSLGTVRHWLCEDLTTCRGKNLACWCRIGASCHADVLLELANPKGGADGG